MHAYIVRRLAMGLLIVWGVYTLTFFAANLAPGDPFQNLENPKMQKEDIERLRAKWGYDKPVAVRYFIHLRKLLWADADVLDTEAAGFEIEVFSRGGKNRIRARAQEPPPEIVLAPDERSRRDFGSGDVRLIRRPDGTYSAAPIARGKYLIGHKVLLVGEGKTRLVTEGVTLEAEGGQVRAEPTLETAPDELVLRGEDGAPLVVKRGVGGRYESGALEPGRYRVGDAEILIPAEPLEGGGPTFDLGTSILNKQPVVSYLARPLFNTALLAVAALFLDFLIGILIGVLSAVRQNTKLDHAVTVGALFVYSMPGFWLGLMLMLLFAVHLKWLPAEGMHGVGERGLLDLLEHMVLPALVLGIGPAAATARFQRSALLEVIHQDYVRTAQAKGLPWRTVIWKHAMRNALLPVITLFGLSLPFLVSGSVIIETIFSWPGMGREAIQAIRGRDVFVLSGITFIATSMVVVGNMVADILYAVADPRLRLE
ncbi:MAG: ABC transporter permease [Planctomycetes bacterium]|nr:ABC transporter permease [Planctomycetota bacterium]